MKRLLPLNLTGDWHGMVVALAIIAADVLLRSEGRAATVFDEAMPIIVALYLGGRIAISAQNGNGSPASTPGRPQPPASTPGGEGKGA